MNNNPTAEETCSRCGSPLRISRSNSNRGKVLKCRTCYRADYYAAHRDEAIQKSKDYYEETRPRRLELAKDWRDKNVARHRHNGWKTKLRLRCSSEEYYNAKFKEQDGKCALCGKPPGRIRLGQDHCHRRKQPRGLLCAGCNFVVGQFEAMRGLIQKIEGYLAQYEKEN